MTARTWVRSAAALATSVLVAGGAACSSDAAGPAAGRKSVELVAVTPASAQLAVGSTLQLAALALDETGIEIAGRQTFWASADTTVAVVSPEGVVTGRRMGAVQVQAAVEGKAAYSFITVVPRPVASVVVAPEAASVAAGSTVQLQASVRDDQGNVVSATPVLWLSSDDAVARVTSTGLVSGVMPGTATITATAGDGKRGSVPITVTGTVATPAGGGGTTPAVVTRVVVQPSPASVLLKDVLQLTATAFDASGNLVTGRTVTWTSSNPAVAAVDAAGRVRGEAVGTATVTATIDGRTASTTVTVTRRPAARIDITAPPELTVGQQAQLTATVRDADGQPLPDRAVTWTSSNGAVLAVGRTTGAAEARSAGTVIITAAVEDEGVTTTTTMVVKAANPPPVTGNVRPTANFAFGCTNLVCTFTDASTDSDGAVTTWEWTFGNGVTSPHRHSDVTYAARGTYTVTLTITDDKGATSTVSKSVTTPTSATVQLVNRQTGRCLAVAGSSTNRGARLVTRNCGSGADQRYALPSGGGAGPIQLAGTTDLRYVMEDPVQGPILKLWSWHGGTSEWWTFTASGQLRNFATNECITVSANDDDENPLDTRSCRSATDTDLTYQQWDVRQ